MINENYKSTYTLTLIGIIVGYVSMLASIFSLLMMYYMAPIINSIVASVYPNGITTYLIVVSLIHIIGALIISSILIYYLLQIKKGPTKNQLIVILILGIISLYVMWISGILITVGAILGLVKYNVLNDNSNKEKSTTKTLTKKETVKKTVTKAIKKKSKK